MPLRIDSGSVENIEKAVLSWINLLEQEKYKEAYELTLHDPYYQWTPAGIESVINGYGLPYDPAEEKCVVTPPAMATNENNHAPYKDIDFFEKSLKRVLQAPDLLAIGQICYDLPINGEWSDLTAIFTIFKGVGFFMLELNEIHVL